MASANINSRILGLPLGFSKLADPGFRVFNKVFIRGANVVTIIPGLPEFRDGNEVAKKYEELRSLVNEEAGSPMGGMWTSASENKVKWNDKYDTAETPGGSYERDRRYYAFRQTITEYRKVMNVLLNEVGAKVAGYWIGGDLSSFVEDAESYGLNFYAENSTTVSETATNTLGDSVLASTAKQVAESLREASYMSGKTEQQVLDMQAAGGGDGEQGLLASTLTAAQSAAAAVTGTIISSNAAGVVMGENVLYPKVWKDSAFDKSYNLSFKFVSPYGDPNSVFEFVYVPFLLLLGLALPRQSAPNTYQSPFLVRMECPGYFNCDMGMITSFSFVKGGSEGAWNENGLPMAMDVTMSVTDLYPTLMAATNMALLRNNIGLSTFLDNMCGLSAMNANIRANLRGSIANKVGMFLGGPQTIKSKATDLLQNTMTSIFKVS